jgi:hypothetical protein
VSEPKCPFSTLHAAALTRCSLAREVVRRGGSEYDCTQAGAHATCSALAERFTSVGLPALGYEDDLTLTPKSAYDRVLAGGLIGLESLLGGETELATDDVWLRVEGAAQRYPDPVEIPDAALVEAMQAWQPARRSRRRR